MTEYKFVRGQRTDLPYTVALGLDEAHAWLEPTWHSAEEAFSGLDLSVWKALKLDICILAGEWLSCDPVGTIAPDFVASWRPRWWRSQGFEARLSAKSTIEALRGGLGPKALKYYGVDPLVRKLMIRMGRKRRSSGPRSGVLFVGEVGTPSMLDSLLSVAASSDDFLSLDPAVSARLRQAKRPELVLPLSAPSLRLGKGRRDSIFQALSETDTGFAAATAAGLNRLFSQLRTDAIALRRVAQQRQASVFVVASDQHRYGSIACEVAREVGAISMVFQHGLPQSPVGFTPARADHYAVFGTSSARFFEEAGVPSNRIHQVGLPRRGGVVRPSAGRALLVPLQPGPEAENRQLLCLIANLRKGGRDEEVILRLHPGDRRSLSLSDQEVIDYWAPGLVNVSVDRQRDPLTSFARTQLVLTANSTLAVDAASYGIQVAAFCADAIDVNPFFVGLPEVRNVGDLIRVLDSGRRSDDEVLVRGTREDAIRRSRDLIDSLLESCRE